MWIGKVSVIMYVFSIMILVGAYFMNQVFNDPILGANNNITFDALDTLTRNHLSLNQQINASLIFGDFIAALTVLFGMMLGSTLDSTFQLIPFANASILLVQGIMFDLACVFLWIYIVANRSL